MGATTGAAGVAGTDGRADLAPLVRAAQRGDSLALQELLDLLTPYVGRLCGPIALQDGFDIVLRPGWCLMESRFVRGGMAAVAERDGARVTFFGGLRLPGVRLVEPVLRPLMAPLGARALGRLIDRLEGPGG
ncbi:hypothetical protein ACGFNX_16530 [Streptomyces sp. NPDC048723]|uniref:hypothetical protein n=1 Tax=Streptomyces sp. NPDC048723 TaxID=3365589 RepID=UPI003714EA9B